MTFVFDFIKKKKLLLACIAVSLIFHLFFVTYFYTHPFLLPNQWKSLFGLSTATPDLLEYEEENSALLEKNKAIEEAFHQVLVLSPHFQQPLDLAELPQGIALSPEVESPPSEKLAIPYAMHWEDPSLYELAPPQDVTLLPEDVSPESLFVPQEISWSSPSPLSLEEAILVTDRVGLPFLYESLPDLPYQEESTYVTSTSNAPSLETDRHAIPLTGPLSSPHEAIPFGLTTDPSSSLQGLSSPEIALDQISAPPYLSSHSIPEPSSPPLPFSLNVELPRFDAYRFPSIVHAASWNDNFHVALKFLPREEDKGYIFSIALSPNFDVSQYSLKHNFYFIIDRSNSVQKHRFSVFKRAVVKALGSMQNCDAFNIYILDKKVTKFTSSPLLVTPKAIRAAEEFLEKQESGTLFAASDIYASLEKILPEVEKDEEIHTAILLTDGNTLHNSPKQQLILEKWVEKNGGKINVYTAAVGQKNNLVMLDLLSTISGGKLLYSDTHASFPRKLAKLILDLKNPVAKDLTIAAIPQYPHAHITLYPASTHLPSLYGNQPYVIYGYIDNPCSFDLIVQGRHGKEWIAIKKSISFLEGEKGTRALEKQWKAQQANLCYSKFLKEGKSSHLKEAKDILKLNRTEIAFE